MVPWLKNSSEEMDYRRASHLKNICFYFKVQKTSKVYRRLQEILGLNDESMVLSVIIR